tara:strand:+ start:229 stop:492 length:264 start_codon:yes stop_codon:yes gene_type:complete
MNALEEKINDMSVKHAELVSIQTNTLKAVESLKGDVDRLERRLYVDNGSPSIQTRLDRHERFIKIANLISYAAITTVITILVKGELI